MKSHRKPSLLKEVAFENDQAHYQRCTAEVCADIFTHYCSDNEGKSTVLPSRTHNVNQTISCALVGGAGGADCVVAVDGAFSEAV